MKELPDPIHTALPPGYVTYLAEDDAELRHLARIGAIAEDRERRMLYRESRSAQAKLAEISRIVGILPR